MWLRGLCTFIVILVSIPNAIAGEQGGMLHGVSCSVVRYYVAKYSASAAETWARGQGATEAQIEIARRCLKGVPVRTAQNAPG
jgi:hypothetical protein